ncbi:Hint domain-containing protein [Actinacidiphila yeochonensis]|uniref:Hint domain-containing protein n=1 Tax=Actinacidiphila yeochonensis TaxID=89050 RepID=UPI00056BA6F6|nr:Hint domain-containing protein [Actinacidiphila yeochonensis]
MSGLYDSMASEVAATVAALDRGLASIEREISQLNKQVADAKAAAKRKAATAARKAATVVSHAAHTTYKAVAKAVNTSSTFFKNHAAAIASFAVSTVVFAGCEAVVTGASGGTLAVPGAIGCGALAGAAGGLVDQGTKCADGQKGACSVTSFGESAVLGAVGGAVGGGIGGALGGKLAESALGGVLPKLVTSTLEGATIGGISGGTTSALDYGLTCSDSQAGCSWSSAGDAVASGAVSGAIGGGIGGALSGVGRSGDSEEPAASGCSSPEGPHSFVGSTGVVMADGSTKPIDQVKAGDKVEDAVPGEKGTQVHTVQKVIVTTTDHDFVDVTVASSAASASAAASDAHTVPASSPGLGKRVLRKAALGLAASAAVVTTGLGLTHHGAPPTAPVAYAAPATAAATPTADVTSDTPDASALPTQGGTLTTTYHHPFYDETRSAFVEAAELHPGDLLQTPTGTTRVTAVHRYHATTTTYDLTIAGLHTYYVVAGGVPILVHNVNLVSNGTCSTATVSPQQLADDARALHDTVGVGTRADRATTVATGQLGGELVYAVNQNGTSRAIRALAERLGYERVFATELTPQVHTDAEQILFNAIDEGEYEADGIIASSRPACGVVRQNCAGRADDYPGIQLYDDRR